MNIPELEETLKKEDLLEIHMDGTVKKYVKGEVIYKNGEWQKYTDVFGIVKSDEGLYYTFLNDSERGISDYTRMYGTEEEACEDLLEMIRRKDRIYKKSLQWYTEKNKK